MKKESIKKSKVVEEDRFIDVHDDEVMRKMGFLRPFKQTPRDKSVWTKTPYEKSMLKKVRHTYKKDMHFHTIPYKPIRIRGKLVITLYKNKYFSKTTYSTDCWEHEIPDVLSKFRVTNKNGLSKNVVRKYSWNGRTYNI